MNDCGIFTTTSKKKKNGSSNKSTCSTKKNTSDLHDDDDDMNHSALICSVVENRAREICICTINTKSNSTIEIYIIQDNHAYNETINMLQSINPDEVLLHDGSRSRVLSKKIEEISEYSSYRTLYISRQYFDQDNGADMLKKVLAGYIDSDLIAKYTVLAGTYCLLKYIENCSGVTFASNSLRIEFGNASAGKLSIDRRTANNLELIVSSQTGSNKESLFHVMNYTKTVLGARLLRRTILRPPADKETIDTRLDMIVLLLKNNQVFSDIVDILKQFPDVDRLLNGLTTTPKKMTTKTARNGIDTLIYLKQTLHIIPNLVEVLEKLRYNDKHNRQHATAGASADAYGDVTDDVTGDDGRGCGHNGDDDDEDNSTLSILDAMINTMKQKSFLEMQQAIAETLTESTSYSKSSHEMRHQECFSVRPGVNGLLDVSRKTFLQSVEDIYALAEKYSSEYSLTAKVQYSTGRGYFLSLPYSNSMADLPPIFTQAVLNKRTVSCSTHEIASLSERANEAIGNALILTHEMIQNVMSFIRSNIDFLFSLADVVALLDMLISFADLVALCPHAYVRPQINNDGPLVIKNGRHPIISVLTNYHRSSFISNDTFISPTENVQIITGPNGSGKSVYLKQVSCIIIMAQCGCFVPATFAAIPIRDRLLSRIGNKDDLENDLSTFMTEMRETSYILENVTPKSLVVVDELGRGTSNIDGVSIAFSVAEALLDSLAFTLFVTHYSQITSIPCMYPTAKNIHLKTTMHGTGNGNNNGLVYLHNIGSGPCDLMDSYGIIMAEMVGLDRVYITQARAIQIIVKRLYPNLLNCQKIDKSVEIIYFILKQLLLLKNSSLDDVGIRGYLNRLRQRVDTDTKKELMKFIMNHDDDDRSKSRQRKTSEESLNDSTKVVNALDSSANTVDTDEDAAVSALLCMNKEKEGYNHENHTYVVSNLSMDEMLTATTTDKEEVSNYDNDVSIFLRASVAALPSSTIVISNTTIMSITDDDVDIITNSACAKREIREEDVNCDSKKIKIFRTVD